MPINTTVRTLDLGYVGTEDGFIGMSLRRADDGSAMLVLYVSGNDGRRNPVVVELGHRSATEFKQLLDHAQLTVQHAIASGQITGLASDR